MKRLPTKAEFKALLKLPNKWDEKRKGLVFTTSNGNELFLTASGYRWGAYVYNVGNGGYYWSATPSGERIAWSLYLSSDEASIGYDIRDDGYSVRLVSDEPCAGYIDMGTGVYWAPGNYYEGEKIYFTWDDAMAIKDKVNDNAPEEHLLTIPESMPIDWEQRRYEITKSILSGSFVALNTHDFDRDKVIACKAVRMADYVIELLKRKQQKI